MENVELALENNLQCRLQLSGTESAKTYSDSLH